MHRVLVTVLQCGLAVVFAVGLFGQFVVIPTTAADEVARFPPYAPYAVPYATMAIVGVACVQLALVALFALLSMIRRGALFSSRALRWVDLIIGCAAVCTALAGGTTAHLLFAEIPEPADSMDVVGALGTALVCTGAGAAFVMLVIILRGMLRKATDLQTEMAGVV